MQSVSLQLLFLMPIKQRVQIQTFCCSRSWQVLTPKHAQALSGGAGISWSQNHAIDHSNLRVWMITWQSSGPFPVQFTSVDVDTEKSWECQGTQNQHTFLQRQFHVGFGTVEHQIHRFKEHLFNWNPLSIASTRILKVLSLKGRKI